MVTGGNRIVREGSMADREEGEARSGFAADGSCCCIHVLFGRRARGIRVATGGIRDIWIGVL